MNIGCRSGGGTPVRWTQEFLFCRPPDLCRYRGVTMKIYSEYSSFKKKKKTESCVAYIVVATR
jgi:hypothetical protein